MERERRFRNVHFSRSDLDGAAQAVDVAWPHEVLKVLPREFDNVEPTARDISDGTVVIDHGNEDLETIRVTQADEFFRLADAPNMVSAVTSFSRGYHGFSDEKVGADGHNPRYQAISSPSMAGMPIDWQWGELVKVTLSRTIDGDTIMVTTPSPTMAEMVLNYFAESASRSVPVTRPLIMLGHGRDGAWKKLLDHLEHLGFGVDYFERDARAGIEASDVVMSMIAGSDMAFIVMTGEDLTADDQVRARQNVVHELGVAQGHLGLKRGIMVVEHGIELMSNVIAVQQIRFSAGRIEESFTEVIRTIEREFPGALQARPYGRH